MRMMNYKRAEVISSGYDFNDSVRAVVAPYGKKYVHAKKVYLTMQDVESRYRSGNLSIGKKNRYFNYIDYVLKTYDKISLGCQEGDPGYGNRYILSTEENIAFVESVARRIEKFGHRLVNDNFVKYMLEVTDGIKDDLEKVKLPR